MTKKLYPTERLTLVTAEAMQAIKHLKELRLAVAQIIRDFGTMPQEAVLAELREALDKANVFQPDAIPAAAAYLRYNAQRLVNNRNRLRAARGATEAELKGLDIIAAIEADIHSIPSVPSFDLKDIEAKLAGLSEE